MCQGQCKHNILQDQAQELGISIIYQELNLVPNLSIAENIFLGREKRKASVFFDRDATLKDSRSLMESVGLAMDPRTLVEDLSISHRQMVAVAKALSLNAGLYIMDEPTSTLTENEVSVLIRSYSKDESPKQIGDFCLSQISRISKNANFGVFLILFVLCALLSIASDKFRTHQNLFPVMRAFSFIAIIAIGQCLVIISGGIDLSVGSVYGFSGLMTAFLIEKAGMAIPIGIIAGLAVGSALGMANGMLISCNDPSALNDVIAKAMADGIKMATFDADTIGSERMFYIGVDNYGVGKLGGKKYAELAAKKPGTVKTALLTRVLGAFNLEERIRGFKDGAQGTNVEIVSIQTCEDDINKAVQVIDDFTNANPELGRMVLHRRLAILRPARLLRERLKS